MRALFAVLALVISVAHAQDYPTKPIHVLVPFAPGGAVDTTARVLAQAMQQRVNWSFVIENRDITTDQAEERVERQARQFELLKPYLVDRWKASSAPAAPAAVEA